MLCVFSNQVKWLVKRHEIIASHDRSPKIIGFLQKRGVVYRRRMCYTQSMEQLWTLLLLGRVWGRHAPTRSLRKCRRIAEVKSQWSTTFSRIENLWPRDGSCPLPLRSKRFISKCFRIVKTQKISKRSLLMYGSHRLLRTKFLPLFCSGVGWEAGITLGRLMKFSRCNLPRKEKYRPRSAAMILSGEVSGKMNRVCCGAVAFFVDFSSLKWWVSRW